jgi:hypothetical protein
MKRSQSELAHQSVNGDLRLPQSVRSRAKAKHVCLRIFGFFVVRYSHFRQPEPESESEPANDKMILVSKRQVYTYKL